MGLTIVDLNKCIKKTNHTLFNFASNFRNSASKSKSYRENTLAESAKFNSSRSSDLPKRNMKNMKKTSQTK